jgi:hypothetical protein
MRPDAGEIQLVMESVKFFCWLAGSVCALAVTLLGIYLRMYVRDALHDHADAIQSIVAENYVRRDVHEEQIRGLRALIEGSTA